METPHDKIRSLKELSVICGALKNSGKKIVHCHGVFDLIHPGHIKHLASAKKQGDILVVTVTADEFVKKGPGRPIFKEDLRTEFLSAITYVDYVAINRSESAMEAIQKIRPDFYVKGPDYRKRKIVKGLITKLESEEKTVQSVGGKFIYTDDVIFSSSKIINEYLDSYPPKMKRFLDDFKSENTAEELVADLVSLSDIKILVVGDAIIDQYDFCLPLGKSSKEPIIVNRYISEETYPGGALATANHIAALVKEVHLLTVLGNKPSFESFIRKNFRRNISPDFFFRRDINTTVKKRFVDAISKQKLFQISMIKDDFIPEKLEQKILVHLKKEINKYDLVIVNDFGHGMLTDKIIRCLCQKSKYLALNVQANSANYGFNVITKYPRADFVCIDEQELRLATHDKYSPLEKIIRKVYKKLKCRQIIITRGADGSLSYCGGFFEETPALTQNIIDRVGAGDALFAVSAPCACKNIKSRRVSFIGNVGGAIQVQTIGNKKPIELIEMTKFIMRLLK